MAPTAATASSSSAHADIIALGGGGFSMEPDNAALDLYVLAQAKAPRPNICFVPTASGDSERYLLNFYAAFARYECVPTHLKLFARTPDLRELLLRQHIIYVGGGNTKSMLAVWKDWGLPDVLREANQQGVVLAGISAGAICWFEQGVTDSWAGRLEVVDCLGMLRGSCTPHYDGEADRRPSLHRMLAEGAIGPGYALDDGAAIHFRNGAVHAVVASRPNARAYQVRAEASRTAIETPLPMRTLAREPR